MIGENQQEHKEHKDFTEKFASRMMHTLHINYLYCVLCNLRPAPKVPCRNRNELCRFGVPHLQAALYCQQRHSKERFSEFCAKLWPRERENFLFFRLKKRELNTYSPSTVFKYIRVDIFGFLPTKCEVVEIDYHFSNIYSGHKLVTS